MADASIAASSGRNPPPLEATSKTYLAEVRRKRLYSGIMLLVFILLMVASFQVAEQRNAGGFMDGLAQLDDFPSEVISEAWEKRGNIPGYFVKFFPSLIETINIALVSTLIGAMAAVFLALLSTRGLARWPGLAGVFRRITDTFRAFPEIVIALILIYILGGGPVPAMIAIAIHTAGALGKLFAEAAENTDLKPVEGLTSVGATWGKRMWLGVVPQVAPNWLGYALLRLEINVRASAILGFVGEGGIGHDLKIAMQWGQGRFDEVVAIFLLLFATIMLIDQLSSHYRDRLIKGAHHG